MPMTLDTQGRRLLVPKVDDVWGGPVNKSVMWRPSRGRGRRHTMKRTPPGETEASG